MTSNKIISKSRRWTLLKSSCDLDRKRLWREYLGQVKLIMEKPRTMLLFFRKMAKLILTLAKIASIWLCDGTLRSHQCILCPIYTSYVSIYRKKKRCKAAWIKYSVKLIKKGTAKVYGYMNVYYVSALCRLKY